MLGPYVAAQVASVIEQHGEAMTLARTGESDISLKGKRVAGGTLEQVGSNSAMQQVFKVLIGTTELEASAWAARVPKRTDKLTIGTKVCIVRDAMPRKDGDTVALYELEVAG